MTADLPSNRALLACVAAWALGSALGALEWPRLPGVSPTEAMLVAPLLLVASCWPLLRVTSRAAAVLVYVWTLTVADAEVMDPAAYAAGYYSP